MERSVNYLSASIAPLDSQLNKATPVAWAQTLKG